jgi:hypothetical protein
MEQRPNAPALYVSMKVPDAGGPDNQIDFVYQGKSKALGNLTLLSFMEFAGRGAAGVIEVGEIANKQSSK